VELLFPNGCGDDGGENKRVKIKLHRLDIIAGPLGPAGMSVFSSGSFCSIGASKLGNCEKKGRERMKERKKRIHV